MNALIAWWRGHGTKILGSAAAIVAGLLVIPELIPAAHVKYWQAVNVVLGVLTLRRGFENSRRQDPATPGEHAARDHTGTDEVQ